MAEVLTSASPQSNLADIYKEIWLIHTFLETTNESTNSSQVQEKVAQGRQKTEEAIQMVNALQLFSHNEYIEEVATSEIKYLLLPALMGYFTDKSIKMKRMEILHQSEKFYKDFLRLCKSYGVGQVELLEGEAEEETSADPAVVSSPPQSVSLQAMANWRKRKIDHYKEKKELERKLSEMHDAVESDSVDDEAKREYYMTLLKKWISTCTDEMVSIHSEIPILEHMQKMKQPFGGVDGRQETSEKKPSATPLQPFILTKTALQKKVFGAGYPSLPTLTIEEFYEQKVRDGTFQPPGSAAGGMSLLQRAADPDSAAHRYEEEVAAKEILVEKDDLRNLQMVREFEDWKDDHRRGWGNRQNMG